MHSGWFSSMLRRRSESTYTRPAPVNAHCCAQICFTETSPATTKPIARQVNRAAPPAPKLLAPSCTFYDIPIQMEFTSGMDLDEPEDILFDAIECSSLNVAPQKADIDLEPVTCSMMMESFQTEELSPIACFSLFSSERSTASARSDRDIEASPRLIHKVSHLEFAADDDHLSAQETPPYGSWRSVKTNASEPKEISLHPPIVMEEPFQRSASAPTVLGLTAVSSRLAADFSRRSSSASETKFIKLTQKRGSVFVGASCTIGVLA
mmetsp:Transcript_46056/g.108052  ORF Transcript_46056/g.108052 Transcript_46056/m.108052 type:complete len:265 (+) Transcript_46056:116-910(+)|eukprot:CAMPEP_0177706078 /NCGR_PEP_ID=MMETSP0484_2-20121128/9035_1 /TAXON_ID=354590 /ORGANISM="Rhodomonas lens, Strain RHODO" /LENGTH=264 /DNA_ID=CAMNT_0019217519 /DNA_START=54 /DNA_END=848 /DNA_ORIENTATION=-